MTDDQHELSQRRWRGDEEARHLTWGVMMTGDSLWDLYTRHHRFVATDRILEIGPGYGRIINTALERHTLFSSWVGVELSESRVARLSRDFPDPRVQFVQGDVDNWRGKTLFDVVISSATLHHLHPDCRAALRNVATHVSAQSILFLDFPPAEKAAACFEPNGTFIRLYGQDELYNMFDECGYSVQRIEICDLDNSISRLVVIASPKP